MELKIIKNDGTRLDLDEKLWEIWRHTPSVDFDGHPFLLNEGLVYRIPNIMGTLEYDKAVSIIELAVENKTISKLI